MSEETAPQAEETEKDGFTLLGKLPGAPDQNLIDTWKSQYGDIFMSGFTEEQLYVWRALNRREWRDLQGKLQSEQMDQMEYEEVMVNTCLLWQPQGNQLDSKAGTISAIAEQVMQRSNFVSPQAASQLVLKL